MASQKSLELLRRALSGRFTQKMYEQLSKLDFRHLQTVLMYLMESKAGTTTPNALLRQYEEDRFAAIGNVGQLTMTRFDFLAATSLPEYYEPLELSPVTVLGANRVLANVNQKIVLGTIRRLEVMADSVTALTLEASTRRRASGFNPGSAIKLATSHREIRVQAYDPSLGFTPHFRSYSLVTMGHAQTDLAFACEHMRDQIRFYLALIEASDQSSLTATKSIRVTLSNLAIMEYLMKSHGVDRAVVVKNTTNAAFAPFADYAIELPAHVMSVNDIPRDKIDQYLIRRPVAALETLEQEILKPLREEFPKVFFEFDMARVAGIGYYPGLCFKVYGKNTAGHEYPLIDGGLTDWGKQVTGRVHERVLASGMGSELFCRFFATS